MDQDEAKLVDAARRDAFASDDSTVSRDAPATPASRGIAEWQPPTDQLGPVKLISRIGRGAMGVVYRGHDRMLDRDVAVKFLLRAQQSEGDARFAKLLDGARVAAKIEHSGLTTVYHADVVDGCPYIVMKLVEGLSLRQLLSNAGMLDPTLAIAVVREIALAVAALHEHGVVHRDIKPSNVLIDRDGGVFVTDFGLSCDRVDLDDESPDHRFSGTPAYMAPEMFEGQVSPRSDVFALGITLFELLTGERPYRGDVRAVIQQDDAAVVPMDRLAELDLPDGIAEFLQRATHTKPMFRYKSAAHFLKAIGDTSSETVASPCRQLSQLVNAATIDPEQEPPDDTGSSTTSYFDRLTQLADERRRVRDNEGNAVDTETQVQPAAHLDVGRPQPGRNDTRFELHRRILLARKRRPWVLACGIVATFATACALLYVLRRLWFPSTPLVFLSFMVSPAFLLAAYLIARRYRTVVPPMGHCVRCGYDLGGNTSGCCPECGASRNAVYHDAK